MEVSLMIEAHATQPMNPALRHAIGVSFSGCLMGITIAYSASACEDMKDDYVLRAPTLQQTQLFSALPPLIALITGVLLSRLQNLMGKKKTIALSAILYFIGYIMITYSKGYKVLFAGRSITGMAMGFTCLALSPYISEISPTQQRGAFTTIMQLQIQMGVMLISILGVLSITFRWNAIIASSIAVVNLALTLIAPESPRWLMSKNKVSEAHNTLHSLMEDSHLANDELEALSRSTSQSYIVGFEDDDRFFTQRTLVPLILSCVVMMFQQTTAINAVLAHSNHIFADLGFPNPRISTVYIATGLFVFTFGSAALTDKIGRKLMLVVCAIICALALDLFAVAARYKDSDSNTAISFTALAMYVIGFSLAWGATPWVLTGEFFPLATQGRAIAIISAVNWSINFITVYSYEWLSLPRILGPVGVFLLYGGMCILGAIFVALCVPETKGKSLEEIAQLFEETRLIQPHYS